MLNKEDIIKIIDDYKLDKNRFLLLSGASLVLHGVKKYTRDIDITVDREYNNKLLKEFKCEVERVNEFNHKVYLIDNIINFGIDYNYENYDLIENIHTQTIDDIIKLKMFIGRTKDLKDIELIKKYNRC